MLSRNGTKGWFVRIQVIFPDGIESRNWPTDFAEVSFCMRLQVWKKVAVEIRRILSHEFLSSFNVSSCILFLDTSFWGMFLILFPCIVKNEFCFFMFCKKRHVMRVDFLLLQTHSWILIPFFLLKYECMWERKMISESDRDSPSEIVTWNPADWPIG